MFVVKKSNMGDVYELEAKSGRIWLNAAKKQVDQSTRIVGESEEGLGENKDAGEQKFDFFLSIVNVI